MKSGRHLAAVGAFAVVALWVVGFFLAGKPPKFDDTSDQVVDYYADHHKQVLIAVVLVAIGLAIYLCVMSQLSLHLRGAGQRSLAPVILVGAAASAGLFAVGDALYGVIAQAVAEPGADPALAKALYQLDQFAGIPMYWLALLPIVLGGARGPPRRVPGWAAWLTWVLAVLVRARRSLGEGLRRLRRRYRAGRHARVRRGARVPARGRRAALDREGAAAKRLDHGVGDHDRHRRDADRRERRRARSSGGTRGRATSARSRRRARRCDLRSRSPGSRT